MNPWKIDAESAKKVGAHVRQTPDQAGYPSRESSAAWERSKKSYFEHREALRRIVENPLPPKKEPLIFPALWDAFAILGLLLFVAAIVALFAVTW